MKILLERTLPSPISEVFAFLSDPRNRPVWQRSLDRVEMLTDGPPRVGTRWREWPLLLGEVSLEIVEFETDRVWAERGTSNKGQLDLLLGFEQAGAETRLSVDARLELPKLLRWAEPLGRPLITAEISGDLRRAAAAIASRSSER